MTSDVPACGTCGGPEATILEDVLTEVRAVRAAIEGPQGLNVRVALVEAAVKASPAGKFPDARYVGAVIGAIVLALASGAGIMAAAPASPSQPDPCVATCYAIGLSDGAVGADGVCECDGWSLADTAPILAPGAE